MKLITKTLLYYSLILSVIIFIVGLVTSRQNSTILLNLFYLPILLYLLFAALNKKQAEITEQRDSSMMTAIAIFVIFFLIGVYNVYITGKTKAPEVEDVSSPIIIQNDEKTN